jgi:S-(hydroxymethyl)glutathione dehydrogenase/alcohol dehydrogenase
LSRRGLINSFKRMQAAVLIQPNTPLEITDLEIPALKRGQVLVKILYSGICQSQLMEAGGFRGPDAYLPHLLGHEASAVVVAIGEGVTKVKPKDNVILTWIKSSGIDAGGTKYKVIRGSKNLPGGTLVNAGAVTTFSNFAVVSENRCVMLPFGMSPEDAILFGCALPTGAGIVANELKPPPGSPVLVVGLGGIGTSALCMALAMGCQPVVGVDIEPSKLEFAKKMGAHFVAHIDALRSKSVWEQTLKAQGFEPDFPFVIDAGGTTESIELAFSATKASGGTCIFASHPPKDDRIKLDPYDLIRGKNIKGSWGGATKPDIDIPKMFDHFKTSNVNLSAMLSEPFQLANINQAMDHLRSRSAVRVIIKMSH